MADDALRDERTSYDAGALGPADLDDEALHDPLRVLRHWIDDAREAGTREPTAMTLSTLDEDGPDARVVLCKGLEGGVVWYSHRTSAKGRQLAADPRAAVTFHWAETERQVRARGTVQLLTDEVADGYFASRPRASQIGAWASGQQSHPVPDRAALEAEAAAAEARFDGQDVPRPPSWGGFRLVPHRIELWQGRPGRLHDRLLLEAPVTEGDAWSVTRLRP